MYTPHCALPCSAPVHDARQTTMLRVWFYHETGAYERKASIFNTLVQTFAECKSLFKNGSLPLNTFCHVEMQFPNQFCLTCYLGSNVQYKLRESYDPRYYTCIQIPCTLQQAQKAESYAQKATQLSSTCTLSTMLSPWPNSENIYCSKLVAESLKQAGVLDLKCVELTPTELYDVIKNDPSAVQDSTCHDNTGPSHQNYGPISMLDFAIKV